MNSNEKIFLTNKIRHIMNTYVIDYKLKEELEALISTINSMYD